MLMLTRHKGESIFLQPSPDLDPRMTVEELFESGPIEVLICDIDGLQVRVGTIAPKAIFILRNELKVNISH